MCKHRKKRRIIACEQVINDISQFADQEASEKVDIIFEFSHRPLDGAGKTVIDQDAQGGIEKPAGDRRIQDRGKDPPDLAVQHLPREERKETRVNGSAHTGAEQHVSDREAYGYINRQVFDRVTLVFEFHSIEKIAHFSPFGSRQTGIGINFVSLASYHRIIAYEKSQFP